MIEEDLRMTQLAKEKKAKEAALARAAAAKKDHDVDMMDRLKQSMVERFPSFQKYLKTGKEPGVDNLSKSANQEYL